jgi:hypothetical protein
MATYLYTTVRVTRPRSICANLLPVEEMRRVALIKVKLALIERLEIASLTTGDQSTEYVHVTVGHASGMSIPLLRG